MEKLNSFCNYLEYKFGLKGATFILSLMLILAGCLYVTPAFHSEGLGVDFESLSVEPFNFAKPNPLQYRILTPLVAHLLFLRGKLYMFFPLLLVILFLSSIYLYFRKHERCSSLESTTVIALIAFSSPVLWTLRFPGYVDITTYFLVFLCYVLIERKSPLWYVLFALGTLNHESIIFMALVFIWLDNKTFRLKRFITSIIFLGLSFIPAILYRSYVSSHVNVEYSSSFYIGINGIKHIIWVSYRMAPLGIFMSFKLFWAIPIVALIKDIKNKEYYNAITICLIIICTFLQLPFSSDVSRVIGLAFLAIIVSVKDIKKYWPSHIFLKGLLILIGFNFLVPQYCVAQEVVKPFTMVPVSILYEFFGLKWRTLP